MTWKQGTVTGRENHEALVNLSDFGGDPAVCAAGLSALLFAASERPPRRAFTRLGLAGVPPIWTDIYERSESMGAGIVYNEVQYEFSMPEARTGIVEQYSSYTYPYGSVGRAAKIAKESARRGLAGLVHYTQSFCYHQLDDAVFRSILDIPILKLEADMPGPMDARSLVRLEAFLESLA
jgi:benzoyl-CoA reductase/2-hydroxyglutaryl-CoA dehydratase subunit BcrC/BadD/HgdB